MFDLKKFVAFIGVENIFMQHFYDLAEAEGLEPRFDIFHVVAGDETPSMAEIKIMEIIYESAIKGTSLERNYQTADIDFHNKIAERNRKLSDLGSHRSSPLEN
jgi:hypothetical protein